MSSGRKSGVVKWYNEAKGYGFITPEDGGADIFMHVSALADDMDIAEGDKVSFDIEPGRKPNSVQATKVAAGG
jgi:CspA family cold shock protein